MPYGISAARTIRTLLTTAHVIIPTHTPRYLELVLAALSRQTLRPQTTTVTCDTDDPVIGEAIRRSVRRTGRAVWWLARAHHGIERLCQIRNNAARFIADTLGARDARLIILDGDMLAPDDLVQRHLDLGQGFDLVYPYRLDATPEQSQSLTPEIIIERGIPLQAAPQQLEALRIRQRRYRRQLLLRRVGLGPLHKPKLLGGHFSCTLDMYLALNGFDELYQGWGFKDDEFARRAARLGARVRIAVTEIEAWHLHHPTRQQGKMRDLETYQRFRRRDLPTVAEHGVRNPLEQHPIHAELIEP